MLSRILKCLVTLMFLLQLPVFVLAQDENSSGDSSESNYDSSDVSKEDISEEENAIIVTASRKKTTVERTTVPVKVITSEDIRNDGKNNFADIVNSGSDIYISRNGGKGGTSSLFLGGAPSESSVIMIDGFKVNDCTQPSGGFNYALIGVGGIKQVEIVKGAQSTLYGSDAMAGVINIIPEDGQKSHGLTIFSEFGTMESYYQRASFSDNNEYGFGSVAAENLICKGISKASEPDSELSRFETDRDHIYSSMGKGGVYLGDSAVLTGLYYYVNSDVEVDGGAETDDKDQTNYDEMLLTGIELYHEPVSFYSYKLRSAVTGNSRIIDDKSGAYGAYYGEYEGRTISCEMENTFKIKDIDYIIAGYQYEKLSFSSYDNYSEIDKSYYTHSGYVQNVFELKDLFMVQGGVRYYNNDKTGDSFTYQGGVSMKLPFIATRIKGSVATGYKSPTLYQLFAPTYGNDNLKPEKNLTYSTEVFQPLSDKFEIGLSWLHSNYDDKIDSDPSTYVYYNIKEIEISEYTSNAVYVINRDEKIAVSVTYLQAKDTDTGNYLARRPEWKYAVQGTKKITGKIALSAVYNYISKRYDDAKNTKDTELKAYNRIDMNAVYRHSEKIYANCRIENLLNENYQEAYGYTTAGFTVYGGAEIRL